MATKIALRKGLPSKRNGLCLRTDRDCKGSACWVSYASRATDVRRPGRSWGKGCRSRLQWSCAARPAYRSGPGGTDQGCWVWMLSWAWRIVPLSGYAFKKQRWGRFPGVCFLISFSIGPLTLDKCAPGPVSTTGLDRLFIEGNRVFPVSKARTKASQPSDHALQAVPQDP
jgi:hypothetical protein